MNRTGATQRSPRHRLFLGIWPSQAVEVAAASVQREIGRHAPSGMLRMTPHEQLHVTLRFLGDVDEERMPDLVRALTSVLSVCPRFELMAGGLGAFPSPERARVVWLGIRGELAALSDCQEAASAASDPFAEKAAEKTFHAHLTLARVRDSNPHARRQLRDVLERTPVRPSPAWTVDAIRLVASELHPDGARYRLATSIPLASTR